MSDDGRQLDGERIAASLRRGAIIGREIRVHGEVDSTNDEVQRLAEEGSREGCVIFADSQVHGRGRRGARWTSSPGKDLLFSVLLRPGGHPGSWPWLTQGAAVAICRVIEALFGLPAKLKWPNDVYLEGNRKVSGILLETRIGNRAGGGHAVMGIGLNVNNVDFRGDLRESAVSLRLACGAEGELEREPIAGALLNELDAVYRLEKPLRAEILQEAGARSIFLNRAISAGIPGGGTVRGRFLGLGNEGELRIQDKNGGEKGYRVLENVRITG